MPDDKAPHDKALELLVYAPVGLALYLRDMLPGMMPLFVSRGKREVQSHLPGSVPTPPAPPMPAMPPVPNAPSAADVRRKVEEGLGMAKGAADSGVVIAKGVAGGSFDFARGFAGSALQSLGSMRGSDGPGSAPTSASDTSTAAPTPAPAPSAAPSPPAAEVRDSDADAPAVESLAIPDYDELSASQVVERLAGLDHTSLDAIRRYELAHRGRNTILGKIAQLG